MPLLFKALRCLQSGAEETNRRTARGFGRSAQSRNEPPPPRLSSERNVRWLTVIVHNAMASARFVLPVIDRLTTANVARTRCRASVRDATGEGRFFLTMRTTAVGTPVVPQPLMADDREKFIFGESCFDQMGTSAITMDRSRGTCLDFAVSSFSKHHHNANNNGPNLNASYTESENRKTRFAIMASRAPRVRGLFENVEMNMERAVAIKRLGKILGKSLGYRVDMKAPNQDERDDARAKLPDATAKRKDLNDRMIARSREILEADMEYQQLKVAYLDAKKCCDELFSITRHYRFTVGTSNSLFFTVRAQGDSWEQVIEKLTERQAA